MIPALTDWSLHSSSKDEKRFCFKHGKDCSLMGKMPPLIEVELSNEEEDGETEEAENEKMTKLEVSKKKKKCILM